MLSSEQDYFLPPNDISGIMARNVAVRFVAGGGEGPEGGGGGGEVWD